MRQSSTTIAFAAAALAVSCLPVLAIDLPASEEAAPAHVDQALIDQALVEPRLVAVPSAEITASVAALLGNPPGLEFRKLQRLNAEAEPEALYCGQVLAGAAGGRNREFQVFTYARLSGTGSARILGSHDLNGMRSGRKTIAWLKRAGCL